ncbi:MAG TPA: hypothetical protein VLM18_05445 [Croceibacterium sp.]|nr:hypothetical protein [Croceibacterium sp.]
MIRLPERLPPLTGRALTAFRVLWALSFVLALVGATFGEHAAVQRNRQFNQITYSLGIIGSESDGVRYISPVLPAIEAQGVKPGSRLLAVDGRSLATHASYDEANDLMHALQGPEGTFHRLQLRDPQGRVAVITLPVQRSNLIAFDATSAMTMEQRMQLLAWANGAISVMFLGGSALLFARRAREPVVALLTLGLLVGNAQLATFWSGNGALIDSAFRFDFETLLMGIALTVFPSGRFEPRWTTLLIAGIVLFVAANPLLDDGAKLAGVVFIGLGVVASNIVRYRRRSAAVERQQVKWATLGIAIAVFLLLVSNGVTYVGQITPTSSVAMALSVGSRVLDVLASTSLVGGLLVSLLRFRLYDADTALSRSATFGALAVGLIAIFAGTEKLLELLAEEYWGERLGVAPGAIAAGIAAALIPPMHHRLNRWAERRFQGPLLDLRRQLPEKLGDWRETATPHELAEAALGRIMDALHTSSGAIVARGADGQRLATQGLALGDVESWLAAHPGAMTELDREDALLPLRLNLGLLPGGATAWLLLGPRPDGTMPGKDERDAAAAIADPLARALSVATLRRQRDDSLASTLKDLAARLARLEARPA